HRLFGVMAGTSLTLENLTLTGGNATGGDGGDAVDGGLGGGAGAGLGGAIFNSGDLHLVSCTLTGNTARGGDRGYSTEPRFGGIGMAGGGSAGFKGGDHVDYLSKPGEGAAAGGGGGVGGPGGVSDEFNPDSESYGGRGGANEFGHQALMGTAGTA